MPTFQTTNLIGAGTLINMAATFSDFTVVTEGVVVGATSGDAIHGTGDDQSVIIQGSVFSEAQAVELTGEDAFLSVSSTGSIESTEPRGNSTTRAVVVLSGTEGVINNSGMIRGDWAIRMINGAITNTGLIEAAGAWAISVEGAGSLFNSGTIIDLSTQDDPDLGTALDGIEFDGAARIENTGLIRSHFDLSTSVDEIINSGTIIGNIEFEAGNDIFRGFGGTVAGTIDGGSDNDIFFIDQADAVIDGGSGDDTVFARSDVLDATGVEEIRLQGAGDFDATGDFETTVFVGNSGNNQLNGSGVGNIMNGQGGNDEINGGAGNDTILGGTGNDLLLGGDDDDLIVGGTGDDTIQGGFGRDILRGQQGADTFVYNDPAGMGMGADRDIINGFNRGVDVIDVSGINDETFTFIGTSAFSGSGDMELRYRVVAGVNAIVEIDEDGNGTVDGSLNLRGLTVLDAGDFVL